MKRSMNYISTILLSAIVSLSTVSCDKADNPDEQKILDSKSRSIELTVSEKDATSHANRFAWQMLKECITNIDDNVSLSPMSAQICFSMLANAANGDSRAQLLNALDYTDLEMKDVNSLNQKLAYQICGLDDNVTLTLANSLWLDRNINPKTDFMNEMWEVYHIESFTIDHGYFARDVNAWCGKQTNGLIPRVVEDGAEEDFALINALYFKGIWNSAYKFDKENTKKDDFHNADGSISRPEYMNNQREYPYYKADNWSAIQIPFGGWGFRYAVVLPNEGCTMEECVESLSDFNFATADFISKSLEVKMPKFKMSNETDLIDVLKRLGVRDIFDAQRSDFSNMTDQPLVIDMVKQSVSFEVNEEGAEAAAVTVVGGITSAGPVILEYEPFIVDRPFIYLIYEQSTGTILFLGSINKF